MRRLIAATLLLGCAAGAAAKGNYPASFVFVHGIVGTDLGAGYAATLPVDVTVDGVCVIKDTAFGKITGPFALPDGYHKFHVNLANTTTPCQNHTILTATIYFQSPRQIAVVAAEVPNAAPALQNYPLGESGSVGPNAARLLLRVAADTPTLAITLSYRKKTQTYPNIAVGDALEARLLPFVGTGLTLADNTSGAKLAGPIYTSAPARALVNAFAVGSAAHGTLTIVKAPVAGVIP